MNKSILALSFCITYLFLCSACTQNTLYTEKVSIQNTAWTKDDIITFTVPVQDTTQLYNIVLKLTNTNDYPFANIYVFSNIIMPNNTFTRDTVEFILSDNKGNWTGKGWRSYTNTFLFRQAIRFPIQGEYTFSFEQAMRCRNSECSVSGISSLEFTIVKR